MADALAYSLLAWYVASVAILCVYGLHRYWLVLLYLRHGRTPPPPPRRFAERPVVTVQLPMFNEPLVARRIIEAACALAYPPDRLEIQILDDSTDETAGIARDCALAMARAGHDVHYLHRTARSGYKAGALADGLATARGEFIAVFDADFVPPRDFLERTIHHFTGDDVGMVQARWEHLNGGQSLLTAIQAMSLDAHFLIEQAARAASGRWFNFNGTAGVWRRRCIEDAGGWQQDTLTEDTDLSYRAQLAGWRFVFLPDVTCPAEIPPRVGAVLGQQHRWNKGLIQTAIKLLPRLLASRAPWPVKLEAVFHLTAPVPYVFVLLLSLLALPGILLTLPIHGLARPLALGIGLACLGLGTLAACTFYVVAQRSRGTGLWRTIVHLPALMALGIGMSVVNTRAVLEAVFGMESPFVRTPKDGGAAGAAGRPDPAARRRVLRGVPEIALGLTMAACVALALIQPFTLIGIPFLVLFAAGYFAVGVPLMRG